jgi:hypothetical protein
MRKTLTAILTAILAATIAAGTITAATLPAHASAPVNWHQRTCTAATAYQRHPSAGRLTTLVVDSTHLGRSYLKADVGSLYADASSPSPKAAKYLAADASYVRQDCG